MVHIQTLKKHAGETMDFDHEPRISPGFMLVAICSAMNVDDDDDDDDMRL
jgi:hypothetical protein